MNQISVSEFKTNPSKYIAMLSEGDIYITKNNKRVAKLTSPVRDKVSAAMSLFDILPNSAALDDSRTERLG